jgi:hypothetical protein
MRDIPDMTAAPGPPLIAPMPHVSSPRPALRGALLSLLCLPLGLALAFVTMKGLGAAAPTLQDRFGPPLFFGVVGVWSAVAGVVWAGLLAGPAARRGVRVGAAVGFGASAPLAIWSLTAAESALLLRAQGGAEAPMHLVFGAIFPAATFGVVLLTTLGVALGMGWRLRGVLVACRCAAAAAIAFAAVDVLMDLAGWRIGAPDAEARMTMVVVLILGLVAATLAGGAVLGRALSAATRHESTPYPAGHVASTPA